MSDNQPVANNQTAPKTNQPAFEILRVYAKDCSLETPNTPAIFGQKWEPEIKVEFDAKPTNINAEQFEIDLRITVTCTVAGKTAFICEVHQAGLFLIRGVDKASAEYLLGGVAPNILFPYAREHISSLVTRASFPPLNLRPINFEAMYRMRKEEEAKKAASAAPKA